MKNGLIKDKDGTQRWFLNGQPHRENGPAIIYEDGDGIQYWVQNNFYHREDGPAIIEPNGMQTWFLHGNRHREDGPAVIYADGTEEWWLNDKEITSDVETWIEQLGLKPWQEWGATEKMLFRLIF